MKKIWSHKAWGICCIVASYIVRLQNHFDFTWCECICRFWNILLLHWSLYHRKAFQQQRDATLEWNVHCELWYSYSSTTGLNFDVSFLFRFSNLNLRSSELSLSTFLSELCNTLFEHRPGNFLGMVKVWAWHFSEML